jgi:hypothetical protein
MDAIEDLIGEVARMHDVISERQTPSTAIATNGAHFTISNSSANAGIEPTIRADEMSEIS